MQLQHSEVTAAEEGMVEMVLIANKLTIAFGTISVIGTAYYLLFATLGDSSMLWLD